MSGEAAKIPDTGPAADFYFSNLTFAPSKAD